MSRPRKVPRRRYKYDAALSFAGEDRRFAAALSRHLRKFGLSVFYDADHQADLWGKTPEHFSRIYGPQSRYVVPLISEYYTQKDWTQFEFNSAQREQRKRGREFILPVRIDDTLQLGLPDSKIRIDARERSVAQIAKLFAEKCGVQTPPNVRTSRTAHTFSVSLLKPDARRALSLIATTALPMPMAYFEKLFPKYDWRRLVTQFRKAGLLGRTDPFIELRRAALLALTSDPAAVKEFNQLWIDRLWPLHGHFDTAAFLVVHLITARRFGEAAHVAATAAHAVEPGGWTDVYLALLQALRRRRSFYALSRQTRLELLNSLGTTLSKVGKYSEALRVFADLRRLSRSYHNSWGTGQALINAGVASHNLGDTVLSVRMYEQAVTHAKRSRDTLLLGRALSNLAQSIQHEDLPRAERLLEESLRAKAKAHDSGGLAFGLAVRAGIAVSKRDFTAAVPLFKKASEAFSGQGMRHEYALSVYNEGRARQDAGQIRAAVRLFAKAREIAEENGFTDVLRLSLNALGAAAFARGQYAKSRDFGNALLTAARRASNEEDELGALHMLAVSELALGHKREAMLRFRQVISSARKRGADEFLSRCLVDSTRSVIRGQISNPDLSRLAHVAKSEQKRRSPVAANIWRAIARVAGADGDDAVASNAYAAAMECLSSRSSLTLRLKLDLDREHFTWAWHRHRYDEGLRVLEDLEQGHARLRSRDVIAVRDQRAVCLQEIGRHKEAEPLHRSAATSAERAGDLEQEERSLNNLGEALRAQGRYREAIEAFRRSEAIALKGRRYEAVISTAHNRALAHEQRGDFRSASRILRQCRDEARRHRLWHEYVRSLEGLGNVAWLEGDLVNSFDLYERAMREARRHGVDELQPRIALSIARGSLTANRAKHGLAVLSKFQDIFSGFTDAHHYLGTLAELQNAVGQASKALETWRASKQHAQALGDIEHVRYCERHETAIQAAAEAARRTEKSLRAAIAVEQTSDQRAVLMIQLVELLLRRKKTDAAQKAFEKALRHCTESHLDARTRDLYMAVADNELSGSRSDQLSALNAYLMAMISALKSEPNGVAELASRITFRLASANSPITVERLRSLTAHLRSALAVKAPATSANTTRFLLWPFELAARLAPYRNRPEKMQQAAARLASAQNVRSYIATGRLTT